MKTSLDGCFRPVPHSVSRERDSSAVAQHRTTSEETVTATLAGSLIGPFMRDKHLGEKDLLHRSGARARQVCVRLL
jgi:hypothetical protein